MTTELYRLEALAAAIDRSAGLNAAIKKEAEAILSTEPTRIKEAWIKILFSSNNEKQLETYVQYQQASLIQLADALGNPRFLKKTGPADFSRLRPQLLAIVEDLLSFVEHHFSRYLNLDEKLPDSYHHLERRTLFIGFNQLSKNLYERCPDHTFITLVLNPLKAFFTSTPRTNPKTYRQLIFLRELRAELLSITESNQPPDLSRHLFSLVIYLNYNSYKLLKHITSRFSSIYSEKSGLNQQLEILAYWLKIINQQQEKPGLAWKPRLNSLKTQLSNWLIEESSYLERKKQLLFAPGHDNIQPVSDSFRVKTNLSVPQLAFFTRLLMDTGVIVNKNSLEVMRFISKTFSTRLAEDISAESFRTKFYTVDTAARAGVKDVVIKLLNQVNKT